MPFTGKKYDDLYQERLDLKELVESYGFELTEQFIGYQFKEDFEVTKDYDPKWVVGKDKNWLKQSDVVISDFSTPSMGTDMELILAKEVFNKKVYAVVPEERRFHPWLKFYSETYYDSIVQALEQIKEDFKNGAIRPVIDKRQYDPVAGEYRLIETTDAQKYIYDSVLTQQLQENSVKGKNVLVLHCASGYRARLAKNMGASQVVGFDLSRQEIRIAEDLEEQSPLGITYIPLDIYEEHFLERVPEEYLDYFDIVIGYFAIDHAMNTKELSLMLSHTSKLMKSGAFFVAMSDNPDVAYTKNTEYGVVINAGNEFEKSEEGGVRKISVFQNNKEVIHFHNFLWERDTIQNKLSANDFVDIEISDAEVGEEGLEVKGGEYWKDYKEQPDQIVIEARKA